MEDDDKTARSEKPRQPLIILLCLIFLAGFLSVMTFNFRDQNSSRSKILPSSFPNEKDEINWNIYRDDVHGFSLKYPKAWHQFSPEEVNSGKSSGLSVNTYTRGNCTTAKEYIDTYVLPTFKDVKLKDLSIAGLDGFIVENKHLYSAVSGPEVYIVHYPTVIQIGFDETSDGYSLELVQEILSSLKLWEPM